MRTFLRLKNRQTRKLPPEFQHDDLRYPDELVATFLRQFTQPGDVVFDPFAGYGTTLIVAEAMDRVPWGVEFDAHRVRYIRSQLQRPANLIHGDSRQLLTYQIPAFDLSIASPPFMAKEDIENPFTNYTSPGNGYAAYLHDLQQIYAQVKQLMKPQARVILEVANLKDAAGVTTLAWDIASSLAEILQFEGEIVIGWDSYGFGYDHSYCLIFTNLS